VEKFSGKQLLIVLAGFMAIYGGVLMLRPYPGTVHLWAKPATPTAEEIERDTEAAMQANGPAGLKRAGQGLLQALTPYLHTKELQGEHEKAGSKFNLVWSAEAPDYPTAVSAFALLTEDLDRIAGKIRADVMEKKKEKLLILIRDTKERAQSQRATLTAAAVFEAKGAHDHELGVITPLNHLVIVMDISDTLTELEK
jgi:hypothetical protein